MASEVAGANVAVQADVTQPEPIAAMVAQVIQAWGRLDVLVNDAAMNQPVAFADLKPTEKGKVTFKETADPSGKAWAKRGAVAGGLVGLIFPPSIIVGAVVGGAGGGIWGKIRDKGFKDDELKAVGESLTPGSSAITAMGWSSISIGGRAKCDTVMSALAG